MRFSCPRKSRHYLLVLQVLCALFSFSVSATNRASCESTAKSSIDNCNKAATAAKAADTQGSGNVSAMCVAQPNVPECAQKQSIQGQANASNYASALNACQKLEDSCNSACAPPPPPPASQPGDAAIMAQKKSQCQSEIGKMKAQMSEGANANKDASSKSDQNANESKNGGGMPQMPQMPQAQTPTPTDAASPTPTPTADVVDKKADCATVTNPEQHSHCLPELKTSCGSDPNAGGCASFKKYFCGGGGPTGTTSSGSGDVKSGEGITDPYCIKTAATDFCSGKGDTCDSCRKLKGLAPLPVAQQAAECAGDPSHMLAAATAAGIGAAGAGGGGGGGGSTASTGGSPTGKPEDPRADGEGSLLNKLSVGVDGGGGGGGGYSQPSGSGSSSEDSSDGSDSRLNPNGRRLAEGSTTLAAASVTEIAQSKGPGVFSIHSELMQSRCKRGRFIHCENKK